MDGPMIMRAALELFQNRNYPGVVAVCRAALTDAPDNLNLRILVARSLFALRRDAETQHELSACLRLAPRCSQAYRLLGELSLRNDELSSAEIFAREAARLDPENQENADFLRFVLTILRPTAAVEKLPAATAAVGCPSLDGRPADTAIPSIAGHTGHSSTTRFPVGTHAEHNERHARDQHSGREHPGPPPPSVRLFGDYLVAVGALTQAERNAALAYHRSVGVRLGAAAVALGFVSAPKLDWAAAAFHSQIRR